MPVAIVGNDACIIIGRNQLNLRVYSPENLESLNPEPDCMHKGELSKVPLNHRCNSSVTELLYLWLNESSVLFVKESRAQVID